MCALVHSFFWAGLHRGGTRFPTCWQVAVVCVLATSCAVLLLGMQLSSHGSEIVKEFRTPEELWSLWSKGGHGFSGQRLDFHFQS